MNKKLLFGLFAACTMLFAVGCTEEEQVTLSPDTVQFSIRKSAAAAGENLGTTDDPYILVAQVFNHNGDLLQKLSYEKSPAFAAGLTETVDLKLVRNQDYTVVFWTQRKGSQSFDYRNLSDIQINYAEFVKEAQNSNGVDAFFGSATVSGTAVLEHSVTLKRPFAQVNVAIPADEYKWATDTAETQLQASQLTVSSVAAGFNAMTGAVTGAEQTDVVFTAAALPTETLDIKVGETTKTYQLLSTNLLLVNDGSSTGNATALANITCTITTANQPIEIKSENTPIQRNYRTNIILESLARTHEFTVTVDPVILEGTNEDADVEKTYAEAIADLITDGGDVTVDQPLNTLDLTNLKNNVNVHLNAEVKNVILGTKASSIAAAPAATPATAPAITINVAKDVAYPNITFTGAVKNYTIKGDPTTSAPLTTNFINDNNTSIANLTLDGIKIVEGVAFFFNHQHTADGALQSVRGLTVQNCVATGLKKTFLNMGACTDIKILSNNISYADIPLAEEQHGINVFACGETLIEGNTITNAGKHSVMINWGNSNVVTINNNIFDGAKEDGIKSDKSRYIVATNNIINVNEYGVRIDRLHSDEAGHTTTLTISNNTISTPANNDSYAICVNNRGGEFLATGTINLTAKDNKVGDGGIGGNRYFVVKDNGMTLTGDCQSPFTVADGVAIAADGSYAISSKAGMFWFADQVNKEGKSFSGQTLILTQDIDLENTYWNSIGQTEGAKTYFQGTFDGQNYTISNLNNSNELQEGPNFSSGLFGFIDAAGATIKNLKINGAKVNGHHWVGVIIGYNSGLIENCHVENATVICTHAGDDPCGDKAGVIAGYNNPDKCKLVKCSAKNSTVTANRDAGQIIGGSAEAYVVDCTAEGVDVVHSTVPCTHNNNGKNLGGLIGRLL